MAYKPVKGPKWHPGEHFYPSTYDAIKDKRCVISDFRKKDDKKENDNDDQGDEKDDKQSKRIAKIEARMDPRLTITFEGNNMDQSSDDDDDIVTPGTSENDVDDVVN